MTALPDRHTIERDSVSHDEVRIALARHGETVWHGVNRYAGGSSDIDLTPLGEQQAQALAQWSVEYRPTAVISSPVRRAVETAQRSAAAVGVPLQIVEGLREVAFGVAEGRTIDELMATDASMVDRFRSDPAAHPFPGSEPPETAADRAAKALRAIAQDHLGAKVLVVAHNTLLRLALCRLLDLPVARYRELFPRLDNAAISEVSIPAGPDRPASLLSLNVRVKGRT